MGSSFRKGSAPSGQAQTASSVPGLLSSALFANQQIPLQSSYFNQFQNFLGSGQLPQPFQQALGSAQQDLAQGAGANTQAIQDTGVRGGQLRDALVNAQVQRMVGLDRARAAINQNLFGQGQNAAFNTALPQTALGAAQNLTGLGAQRIGQNQLLQKGVGALGGSALGALGGMPLPKGSGFGSVSGYDPTSGTPLSQYGMAAG